jgi:hypothetical protein
MLAAGIQPPAGGPPGQVVGRGQRADGHGPPGLGLRPGLDWPGHREGRNPPPDAGHKRPKDEPGQDDLPESDHYPDDEQHDDPHGDTIAYPTGAELGSFSPTARWIGGFRSLSESARNLAPQERQRRAGDRQKYRD